MKDIMLRIVGKQINRENNSEEELMEFVTEGKLYKKEGSTYIVYEETEMSGLEGVKTTLRIARNSEEVKMKRFGHDAMGTVMEFRKGERVNSMYDTPFGLVPMELLTYKIDNGIEPDEARGKLFIDYEISLKGLSEARNLLNIEVSPSVHTNAENKQIKN